VIPLLVVTVLFGLTVGSFLNVCIDRLPAGESIVHEPSHCPVCMHPLRPLDLVPVLSYLWLRGRCRYCRAPIPVRVPIVETVTAVMFGLLYWKLGPDVSLGITLFYASVLLIIFVTDLEHQLILNVVVFPTMAAALALSFLSPDPIPLNAALGGGVGFVAVGVPFLLTRGRGMGEGDVKLGGLIGLMVGFPQVVVALWLAVVGGGVMAILLLALRIKGRKDPIPFGTFMATAALVTLLWGQAILDWYPPRL
jgi:leader peptidase (prepilin peptidase)/N-methyltransferase